MRAFHQADFISGKTAACRHAIETHRDMVVGLMALHLSSASHRMNEVMKTLAIVATSLIPLTFLAGGLRHELRLHARAPMTTGVPGVLDGDGGVGGGLLLWLRCRGWSGAPGGGANQPLHTPPSRLPDVL